MYICENCKIEKEEKWSSGRFCSMKCSRGFSTKSKREDINKKVSDALTKYTHEMKICKECKIEFITYTSMNRSYCSRSCVVSYTNKNRIVSDEHRKTLRILNAKWLEKYKVYPRFNPIACEVIDNYGKEHGYNFQHALNGGEFHIKELGYWVDGYDKDLNIVIEIDEKSHNGILKRNKDIKRQIEIEKFLKCTFIRLKI